LRAFNQLVQIREISVVRFASLVSFSFAGRSNPCHPRNLSRRSLGVGDLWFPLQRFNGLTIQRGEAIFRVTPRRILGIPSVKDEPH